MYTYVTNTTRSPLLMITSSRIVCFCNIFCLVYCCTDYNYSIHKLIILITPKPDLNEYMMMFIIFYYPNLVILPVDNNEHQRIDDVSTDRISYDIRSVEKMGFTL